jgi:flavodoxin
VEDENLIPSNDEASGQNARRAIVIYDSRYGNTEKIAKSFESGLKVAGLQSVCINAKDASPQLLREFDLIALGAPTEWHSASKPMKKFLESLKSVDLTQKYGFAFDTKLTRPFSGSAASLIEKEFNNNGIRIIAERESATVFLENGSTSGAWLKQGEEKRFEEIGRQVGTIFLAREPGIPA